MEIATRVPDLPESRLAGALREAKHAESPVITARNNLGPTNDFDAIESSAGDRSGDSLSDRFARLSVRIETRGERRIAGCLKHVLSGPPGIVTSPVSPDGKYVIGVRDGQALLVSLDGAGQSRVLPDLSPPGDRIVQWSADSHRLYVYRRGEPPARVWLYEVETGRRQP
jgi:hypothetical protein